MFARSLASEIKIRCGCTSVKMWFPLVTKLILPAITKTVRGVPLNKCHSIFSIKNMFAPEESPLRHSEFLLSPVGVKQHDVAINMLKQHYLNEHVLVRARNINFTDDCAIDEYLICLFKQGNTLLATTDDGTPAGICVGFASSPADVKNLRNYAFYRQNPNTKDFLYFTAKLQETPNLWETFKEPKIFEIRMLAVAPEYRRKGLATSMVERAMMQAYDQGLNVTRIDCINSYDYKVAERNMLRCIAKFPLHKLRGTHAPFIKRGSPHNVWVRVYVAARQNFDVPDLKILRDKHQHIESLIE